MSEEQHGEDRSFSAADKLDNLSGRQRQQVESKSRPNAALIHETIRAEGASELERTVWALTLSGLAAGLSMGFSLIAEGLLAAALPPGPARALGAPLGYTVGFIIVVLGRQQLFTENTLTPILPLLHNRNQRTLLRVLRLWAIVLAANILGTMTIAAAIAHSHIFNTEQLGAFSEMARETIRSPFGVTFIRAVFAGWLVALMVWLLPAAEGSRLTVIAVITYIIALGGFSHIIAGSVECSFLVFTTAASWHDFAVRFFIPTLLGNIVGGVALVAVLNYGQVAPEVEGSE